MNERWQRVADLFSGATALQIEDRALFLEIACGADPELRREVESLLLADATCENDRFLRTPIDEIRADLNIPADARRSDP